MNVPKAARALSFVVAIIVATVVIMVDTWAAKGDEQ